MTKQLNLREFKKKKFERLFRIITCTFCMHTEKQITDVSVKSFEFTAVVWVFHVYQDGYLISEWLK